MSPLALADPDQFLPAHINGRVFADPYEAPAPTVRRITAEVVATEAYLDAELLDADARTARMRAALAAYEDAIDLTADTVRIPKYDLEICDNGHLHRNAALAGA